MDLRNLCLVGRGEDGGGIGVGRRPGTLEQAAQIFRREARSPQDLSERARPDRLAAVDRNGDAEHVVCLVPHLRGFQLGAVR